MKVRESIGPPPGNYDGKFSKFTLTRGSHPKYVHQSQNGPQLRYEIMTPDGILVPGSFPLDFDHYRLRNVLGAFGVPATAVKASFDKMGTQQFCSRLEKKIKQQGKQVTVWVRDTGGWISTIKPADDTYMVRFERIMTRDKDSDEPEHLSKPNNFGGADDTFWVVFVVAAGDHQGASFIHRFHYGIKKEGRSYELDVSGKRGKEFNDFFKAHGIDLSKYNPQQDFANSDNALPELEPLLKKSKALLTIKVEDGWVKEVSKAVQIASSMISLEDDDRPTVKRKKRSPNNKEASPSAKIDQPLEAAHSIVKRVFVAETNIIDLFDVGTGNLSPVHKQRYIQFVKRHKLPKKFVEKYVMKDVIDVLKSLGYDDLVDKFEVKVDKPFKSSRPKKKLQVLRRKKIR